MTYAVCRQNYYYTRELMVEITEGGIDYAGADMLAQRYPGELEEYDKPQSAALAAVKIQRLWQAEEPDDEVQICVRGKVSGAFGLEGDPISLSNLRKWAQEKWENMPRCPQCGEAMEKGTWGNEFTTPEYPFCSEHCAEEDAATFYEEEE